MQKQHWSLATKKAQHSGTSSTYITRKQIPKHPFVALLQIHRRGNSKRTFVNEQRTDLFVVTKERIPYIAQKYENRKNVLQNQHTWVHLSAHGTWYFLHSFYFQFSKEGFGNWESFVWILQGSLHASTRHCIKRHNRQLLLPVHAHPVNAVGIKTTRRETDEHGRFKKRAQLIKSVVVFQSNFHTCRDLPWYIIHRFLPAYNNGYNLIISIVQPHYTF
jgi:hypothetical protein